MHHLMFLLIYLLDPLLQRYGREFVQDMPVKGVGGCARSVPAARVASSAPEMALLVSTATGDANMPRSIGTAFDPSLQVHVLKSLRSQQKIIRQLEDLKDDKQKLLDAFRRYIEDPDYRSENHSAVLELLEQVRARLMYLLC